MVPHHQAIRIRENHRFFKLRVDKFNTVGIGNIAILDPSFSLTSESLDLFSLTPGFVPTPSCNLHSHILRQTFDFVRKLQWRLCFSFPSDPPRFHISGSTRWPPVKCVPPHVARLTRRILAGVRTLCRASHQCNFPSNLTRIQSTEVARLASCDSTVTTADKGGRWTIVPTSAYVAEARRQLCDQTFYRPIDTPPTAVHSRIVQLLNHLLKHKFLTTREHRYFLPSANSKNTREFKLLPKLHKEYWPNPHMPPGRPIVSDVGSVSRNVGELIDFFLQPLCSKLPSHLKDTQHLIAILRQSTATDSSLLFTLDVESLYTSIPIDEGLDVISRAFLQYPDPSRPDLSLLTLLRLILCSNNFSFDAQEWLQIHGVAMGKVFGGAFANLFLGQWEKRAMSSFPQTPDLWIRFQDDILGLWDHGVELLHDFVTHLNSQHPKIRVQLKYGRDIAFLDLRICIVDTLLQYSVFFKDTDGHLILPPTSHHPPSTFKGLLYGETLRFATHSSLRCDFEKTMTTVVPVWQAQGYTRTRIRHAKSSVLFNTGQLSSWDTGMIPCSKPRCPTCPFANFTNFFKHSTSSLSYPILYRLSCDSSCVVYVIECSFCGMRYVGQTRRSLRERILQHLRSLRGPSHSSALRDHFNACGLQNFSFFAVSRHPNDKTRLAKEASWICALHTKHPHGLNSVTQSEPPPTTLVLPYNACATRVARSIKTWCRHLPIRVSYKRSRNLGELLSNRRHQTPQ